jgi:hypothetical protein
MIATTAFSAAFLIFSGLLLSRRLRARLLPLLRRAR